MKKHCILLCAMLLSSIVMNAQQMFTYGISVSNETYNKFTDGTLVTVDDTADKFSKLIIDGDGNCNFTSVDDMPGFPIGFDFTYNGKVMNQFMIGTDGVIFLGNANMTLPANNNPFFFLNNNTLTNALGIFTRNKFYGNEDTEIRYKLDGTAGNRILTIQYSNVGINSARWGDPVLCGKINFQIRLYEENSNFDFHLNDFKPLEGADCGNMSQLMIGAKGEATNDMIFVKDYTGGTSLKMAQFVYDAENYPADGSVYTFIAPEKCQTPTMQPSNVKFYAQSTGISATYDIADADHYMLLVNKENNFTDMPVDKTTYKEGDLIGSAVVAGISESATMISKDVLEKNTTYYTRLIAYNAQCLEGPLYNNVNPVEGVVTTLGEKPEMISSAATINSITLSLNAADQDVILVMNDKESVENEQLTGTAEFGTPLGELKVGDILEGGGKVIYVGKSTDAFVISDLKQAGHYFFRSWTTDGKGGYSSEYAELNLTTALELPWKLELTGQSENIPAGWQHKGGFTGWKVSDNSFLISEYRNFPEDGTYYIQSPFFILPDEPARIINHFLPEDSYGDYLNLSGDNYFAFQISENGKDFVDLFRYDANNKKVKKGDHINGLDEYAGKTVTFRYIMYVKEMFGFTIDKMIVEKKPVCDYPIDVTVTEIEGNSALVSWTPQTDETEWEISYKNVTDQEWGAPIKVSEKPYRITDFNALTPYELRIRGIKGEFISEWSEIVTFQTNFTIPVDVNFNSLLDMNVWTGYKGLLSDSTKLEENAWAGFKFDQKSKNKLYFKGKGQEGNAWFVSPLFTLNDNAETEYEGEITITSGFVSEGYQYSEDQALKLVLSKDGETFNTNDVVFTINKNDFPEQNTAKTYKFNFKGYAGDSKFAFYSAYTGGFAVQLFINSMKITSNTPTSVEDIDNTEISFADGKLSVSGSSIVEIFNINGVRMMTAKNVSEINCSSLPSGIYVAKVTSKEKTEVKKFMIK